MSEIYIYPPDCEDFATIGECGRLTPLSCKFEELAGGMSEITMEHPLDAMGRYTLLRPEAILKTSVPVRTTPEIDNGQYVTSVARYVVKNTTTKAQRTLYKKATKNKKIKVLPWGAKVIVVQWPASGNRCKCKWGKKTGWMEKASLDKQTDITIPDTPEGMETVVPSWESKEQCFRIYNVTKADAKITVNARHISYDLSHNITTYNVTTQVQLQAALDGILNNCLDEHEFEAYTDISGTRAGTAYRNMNPMEAMLDPEDGVTALWGAQLVRDDWDLFFLNQAGENRGVRIEYAKNLKGIDMSINSDDVVTHLRPVAKAKNGSPLYLPENGGYVLTTAATGAPYKKIEIIQLNDQVSKTNTASIVYNRMRAAAQARIDEGCADPAINVRIDFVNLGHSERYSQYRDLQNVFLYDTIRITHTPLGIDVDASVTRIVWDCVNDKLIDMELGELLDMSPRVSSWQLPSRIDGNKLTDGTVRYDAIAGGINVYSVVLTSSSGGEVSGTTTITAHVYYGADDVTDNYDSWNFTWYKNGSVYPDAANCHALSVTVPHSEVSGGAAQFTCEFDDTATEPEEET